jgi:hypothetical protein
MIKFLMVTLLVASAARAEEDAAEGEDLVRDTFVELF